MRLENHEESYLGVSIMDDNLNQDWASIIIFFVITFIFNMFIINYITWGAFTDLSFFYDHLDMIIRIVFEFSYGEDYTYEYYMGYLKENNLVYAFLMQIVNCIYTVTNLFYLPYIEAFVDTRRN